MLATDWQGWLEALGPLAAAAATAAVAIYTIRRSSKDARHREREAGEQRHQSEHALWLLDARQRAYAELIKRARELLHGGPYAGHFPRTAEAADWMHAAFTEIERCTAMVRIVGSEAAEEAAEALASHATDIAIGIRFPRPSDASDSTRQPDDYDPDPSDLDGALVAFEVVARRDLAHLEYD
jgi:hypothetical protein